MKTVQLINSSIDIRILVSMIQQRANDARVKGIFDNLGEYKSTYTLQGYLSGVKISHKTS